MAIVALDAEPVGGSSTPDAGFQPAINDIAGQNPALRTWHDELKRAIRDPQQLVTALELPPSLVKKAQRATKTFPLFAPWPYIARMAKGDPDDPLVRQVLPLADELDSLPGF